VSLRPRVWGSLREAPGLEREILAVAQGFADVVTRIDAGTPPTQIIAHLQGDRHVLNALQELLARGELTKSDTPQHADGRAA